LVGILEERHARTSGVVHTMKVGIIGVGKVGSAMMACFAKHGHDVLGYDIRPNPLDNVSRTEKDLELLVKQYNLKQRIRPLREVVGHSEILFFIVQTPSQPSGLFSISFLEKAVRDCARIDKNKVYAINSTVPPGTCEYLSRYCKRLYYNPLYIRLGTVIEDLEKIKFVLIGCRDTSERPSELIEFWKTISEGEVFVSDWKTVEVTKMTLNLIMTTNISLINKLGEIYRKSNADFGYLKQLLTLDKRFQLASYTPGLGYGGPCLPRDTRMMTYYCRQIGVNANLFQEVENINMEQIQRVLELCKEYKRVGVYGIGYKVGSEILTDSQGWILVQELKKLGKHVEIYDPYNAEESTVKTEEELAKKSDIIILTLPYKTRINVINLWE